MYNNKTLSALKKVSLLLAFSSVFALSGCGSDDDNNEEEIIIPPPVVSPAPTVTKAENLTIEITDAQISEGKLVVSFTASDEQGYGFVGIEKANFTVAKLVPGANGDNTQWQSFVLRTKDQTEAFPGIDVVSQAYNEGNGTLVDAQDGHYQYTYATDVLNLVDPVSGEVVPWEDNLTHRIGIEVRGSDNNPDQNAVYDWVPSGDSMTLTRDIVNVGSCNQCHTKLALHGQHRLDTAYCVTCHNPGSPEPISGETVDFKVMVHKIHRGAELPSIAAQGDGAKYSIFGYRNSEHTYAENIDGKVTGVHLPQDIRNCTNCHVGAEDKLADPTILAEATADGDNWKQFPTIESCGSCHDDIAFNDEMKDQQPMLRDHGALFPASNEDCATCHGSGQLYATENFHTGYLKEGEAAAQSVTLEALAIAQGATATELDVTIKVLVDDQPVVNVSEFHHLFNSSANSSHSYILINWDDGTGHQVSYGSGANLSMEEANCIAADIAGEFICTWNTANLNDGNPIDYGTVVATFADAGVCISVDSNEVVNCEDDAVESRVEGSTISKTFFDMATLSITEDYEEKIGADMDSCKTCHGADALLHRERHQASDLTQCVSCHNATRAAYYNGRPADLKFMVHKVHAANAPVGNGHGVDHYPAKISDCQQCHTAEQIDLPLAKNNRPSLTTVGAGLWSGKPSVYTSPATVACASCHIGAPVGYIEQDGQIATQADGSFFKDANGNDIVLTAAEQNAVNHMILAGGAVFGAATAAEATNTEACATCHAIDKSVGVDQVHGQN